MWVNKKNRKKMIQIFTIKSKIIYIYIYIYIIHKYICPIVIIYKYYNIVYPNFTWKFKNNDISLFS